MDQPYNSHLLERAVQEFAGLPGIGRRTALRLVLHLLRSDAQLTTHLAQALVSLRNDIHYCRECHNISDEEVCPLCADASRNKQIICVVENIQDVMAIERTAKFSGSYHVLGGIISPMNGVSPNDLQIDSLVQRVATGQVKEVIFALSSTLEGNSTCFFIARKLSSYPIELSTLARGIPVGDELEYADEVTLGQSIEWRIPYQKP